MLIPKQKIKVFISSACGDDCGKQKYSIVRAGLKLLIESTQIAKVYLFEDEGASTISAGQHYTFALEECDVCIFLIDNKDGIPNGVQVEIDTVKKYGIKALYYFCDQASKEETPLQKSLQGAENAKSKTVHSFEGFLKNGATDLIDDLIMMYKCYCKGKISWKEESFNTTTNLRGILANNLSASVDSVVQKDVLTNIDNCKSYFSQLILGQPNGTIVNTCELDKLCFNFLPVLFDGVKIWETNNLGLVKKELRKQQTPSFFLVTEKRYAAIKAYFLGNQYECIANLKEALEMAKEKHLPSWFIQDILIDLRNQNSWLRESANHYLYGSEYQEELDNSDYLLYYPSIDRFDTLYYEKLTRDEVKHKLQSPYTIAIGNDFKTYTDLLASIFVTAMYNGSLTHLHMLYRRIMVLVFFCAERYSNWSLKVLLLKTALINFDTQEINGIIRYHREVLSNLNAVDANEICLFMNNRPLAYQRFFAKLEALRVTGYFLSDVQFSQQWDELYELILEWVEKGNASNTSGRYIFAALEGISLRVEQDRLVEILCLCVTYQKNKFNNEVFNLILNCVSLNELSLDSISELMSMVIGIICDENKRKCIRNLQLVLCHLRKQNRNVTEELDKAIRDNMPEFYQGNYRLETTENESIDKPVFLKKYIEEIKKRNAIPQGGFDPFFAYGDHLYETIKSIMQHNHIKFSDELIDMAFKAAYETIMDENQAIYIKMSAIDLMVLLIQRYPEVQRRKHEDILQLLINKETIETGHIVMTNLNTSNLRLCALLLYSCFGEEVSIQMMEVLADMGDDTLSQIKASQEFLFYLECSDQVLQYQLESIILQYSLRWCNTSDYEVRWTAVKILFQLLRNPRNKNIVSNQLVKLVDSDNIHTKIIILRNLHKIKKVDIATYNYVVQKATLDTNYAVRKIATKVVGEGS